MAEGIAVTAASGGPTWVGQALNGAGQWDVRAKAPYLLGLLMLFDSWDSVVIAFTLPSLIAEWQLSALEAGWLISAGYGGQFLGALLFGSLAEKYGRLPILWPLVIVMSLLAIACALTGSYTQLLSVRFVQGLAIGGALPIAICYVNEIAPTATRGRYFGSFQFLMTSGFGLAALASALIIPTYGWRTMFAIGATPLLMLPFIAPRLPESPRWLAARGRTAAALRSLARLGAAPVPVHVHESPVEAPPQAAPKAAYSRLFAPDLRRRSTIIAMLWFLTSLVSFGLVTWIPSIYVSMFGIPVADALRYNAIVALSIFILPIILRQSIDRIGRRPPAIIGTGIGGIALLAMAFASDSPVLLLVTLAIIGQIGISAGSMILWPYTAESYDTRVRSLALGTSSSLARGASMLTPVVVGGVMQATGSVTLVFAIFGSAAVIVALLWLFATQETAGREIDDA